MRAGTVSLKGSYARVEGGEVYVYDFHITPYEKSGSFAPDPKRRKKLLLKGSEIRRLYGKTRERGFTLVPLSVYFNERGYAKLKLGLCRGKKLYDKREAIKEREIRREREADLRGRR